MRVLYTGFVAYEHGSVYMWFVCNKELGSVYDGMAYMWPCVYPNFVSQTLGV
jgi:hypothetical protein